jgi:hypothetical protein
MSSAMRRRPPVSFLCAWCHRGEGDQFRRNTHGTFQRRFGTFRNVPNVPNEGDLSEIDAARELTKLASIDCFDFLEGGFELVDLMGEFAAPTYVLEVDEPNEKETAEISLEIRQSLSVFVMRAKSDG